MKTYDNECSETVMLVLMRDIGLDRGEAEEYLGECRQAVLEGADPEDLLYEIGLEPDYIWALI